MSQRSPAVVGLFMLCMAAGTGLQAATASVKLIRTPNGGIQPQAAVDADGVVHLIYFKGDPKAGDIYYVQSTDGGQTFTEPVRVNSKPGTAIAVGTIRGAQLALGRAGRVHVAWNGSRRAVPADKRKQHGNAPMLYTRLNDQGTAFEPQRNLMSRTHGLDGGGSVAADAEGNVYVTWHGVALGQALREEDRHVWVAHSTDDGKTFAEERRASHEPTGACGCCCIRAAVDGNGRLLIMYRTATQFINRDMRLLVSSNRGDTFQGKEVDPWRSGQCPMSSASIARAETGVWLAWETGRHVHFQMVGASNPELGDNKTTVPGRSNAKHPDIVPNSRGEVLVVWTEGTGWNRGGAVAWQGYDSNGKTVSGAGGRRDGVPKWSFATAFAQSDGSFTVVY